jgi:antitoxin ParD1/3/4
MPDIQKVSIALTGEQLSALKSAVKAGEWQWKRELRGEELERLRQAWEKGIASGPAVPMDMNELLREARRRLKKATEEAA